MSTYFGFEPTDSRDYVFVSYTTEDSVRVGEICLALAESGVQLWYDHGIPLGASWQETIARKIDQSQAVLLFASRNTFTKVKSWGPLEWQMANIYHKPIYTIFLDTLAASEIPHEHMAWWIEICHTQCIMAEGKSAKDIANDSSLRELLAPMTSVAASSTDQNDKKGTGKGESTATPSPQCAKDARSETSNRQATPRRNQQSNARRILLKEQVERLDAQIVDVKQQWYRPCRFKKYLLASIGCFLLTCLLAAMGVPVGAFAITFLGATILLACSIVSGIMQLVNATRAKAALKPLVAKREQLDDELESLKNK